MKTVLYGAAIFSLLLCAACSTIDMSTYEDEYVYARLETNKPKQVSLTVDNRSEGAFALEQGGALCLREDRESPLILVTGTGNPASQVLLSPGARRSWDFIAQDAIAPHGGQQGIDNWVPDDSSVLAFRFTYRLNGEERTMAFPDPQERTLIGRVQVSVDIPLPFLKSVADRRRKVYEQAMDQARAGFGSGGRELSLVNLRFNSVSNGFVEKVAFSADIVEAGK